MTEHKCIPSDIPIGGISENLNLHKCKICGREMHVSVKPSTPITKNSRNESGVVAMGNIIPITFLANVLNDSMIQRLLRNTYTVRKATEKDIIEHEDKILEKGEYCG